MTTTEQLLEAAHAFTAPHRFAAASDLREACDRLARAEGRFALCARDHLENPRVGVENLAAANAELANARDALRALVTPDWMLR